MLGHRARVSFREIGTKAMYDKTSPGLETPGTPTVESLTNRPTCNATIEGFDACGPETHQFVPKGDRPDRHREQSAILRDTHLSNRGDPQP